MDFNFITSKLKFQIIALIFLSGLLIMIFPFLGANTREVKGFITSKDSYWFLLHRKSNKEFFYKGTPGDRSKSELLKVFDVKTGIPGERPTPLPALVGRDYWLIIGRQDTKDDPVTAPYFLTLDIPYADEYPHGPEPYLECDGQCDWILPGSFGLHGVNGDESRLDAEDPGSSGCVRHRDADIALLYKILDTEKEDYRYYIYDI